MVTLCPRLPLRTFPSLPLGFKVQVEVVVSVLPLGFVTSYKPGPSLSTKFVDRDCSLSESSFTESCTNFNHEPTTTLQSNV